MNFEASNSEGILASGASGVSLIGESRALLRQGAAPSANGRIALLARHRGRRGWKPQLSGSAEPQGCKCGFVTPLTKSCSPPLRPINSLSATPGEPRKDSHGVSWIFRINLRGWFGRSKRLRANHCRSRTTSPDPLPPTRRSNHDLRPRGKLYELIKFYD